MRGKNNPLISSAPRHSNLFAVKAHPFSRWNNLPIEKQAALTKMFNKLEPMPVESKMLFLFVFKEETTWSGINRFFESLYPAQNRTDLFRYMGFIDKALTAGQEPGPAWSSVGPAFRTQRGAELRAFERQLELWYRLLDATDRKALIERVALNTSQSNSI